MSKYFVNGFNLYSINTIFKIFYLMEFAWPFIYCDTLNVPAILIIYNKPISCVVPILIYYYVIQERNILDDLLQD